MDEDKYRRTIDYLEEKQGASARECREALGLDMETVRRYAAKAGISHLVLSRHYRAGMRFGLLTLISPEHGRREGRRAWLCRCDCGNSIVRPSRYFRPKARKLGTASCGCLKHPKGDRGYGWKGGKIKTRSGYVKIRKPDHPRQSNGYVYEHILTMEQQLGRYITQDETVHHKNGIRDDNKVENLELWSRNHGTGGRVEDKTTWAINHLRKYAPHILREYVQS